MDEATVKEIREILEMLKRLYCFKCEYAEECSPEAPERLYQCKKLEEWLLTYYRRHKGEG
ncbi:hypothetical protein B6U99_03790 [Candidatus Geothermarchaeota archaeon ex4572_27]|nr:MAG: hypothetical protein B6U99_03790 [Candidatus Geothermarchaeota archaeon ex4572_27]